MLGDWIYYPAAIVLLFANLAGWSGNFYRLPGNWIIVANSTLAMFLLPTTASGLGLGWFSNCLIVALAFLGDSFNYASKRHRIFSSHASAPVRQRVLVGAGMGSLTCVLAGMTVPVIGSFLAVLGAVGGAAGGAWLGSVISPRLHDGSEEKGNGKKKTSPPTPALSRFLTDQQLVMIPRIVAGLLMIVVCAYSSLF